MNVGEEHTTNLSVDKIYNDTCYEDTDRIISRTNFFSVTLQHCNCRFN